MKLAKFIGAAATVAALTGFGPTAQAATITTLFNTGVDSSGTSLPDSTSPDPHYTLVVTPGGASTILVRTSAGGFPIPPYLGDDSISAWIGPNNALTGPGGPYVYETTFSLAGFNPLTAVITGQWSSDNAGIGIALNGVPTVNPGNPYGTPGDFSYQHWVSFVINSGFVAGSNTLDFVVFNGNGDDDTTGPTALRVEMTGTAIATPLPAALPLFVGGLGVLGMLARRRRRKATSTDR